MKDEKIKEELLYHRIIVTRNSADFIQDAPVHEYGVISLAHLSFVDPNPDYAKNKTAQMISKALSDYSLCRRGQSSSLSFEMMEITDFEN